MSTALADRIGAEYILTPATLFKVLKTLVEARRPTILWGPPGVAKSAVARQVADALGYIYIDVRALLLDPVDLRGIPRVVQVTETEWVTRWAHPVFLPPTNSTEKYLINLEELPSATPMVQAALYQLVLDRACGEYILPEGAALIACGNRESDRGVAHRMPTPLASRFVHLEVGVDWKEWLRWASGHDIATEVLSFIMFRPDLLHQFDPQSKELTFPCPRTWEFVSDIVKAAHPDPMEARTMFRGTVGEGAAVEFAAFLNVCRDIPSPYTILNDPHSAPTLEKNPSALIALCGSLHRLVTQDNMEVITTYAGRLQEEVGEFLVTSCAGFNPEVEQTRAFVQWQIAHQDY